MDNDRRYKSTIKSHSLFYIETKKLATYVLQGLNQIELQQKVIDDNLFQVKTERRKREIASAILRRLKALDDDFVAHLLTKDLQTGKLIVLYSILKTDRLFDEFMNEVFRGKISQMDNHLTDRDFHLFFKNKRGQSPIVAKWKDYTFYKLKQVYIRILYEAGLLKNQKGKREIVKPIIDPDVEEHFKEIGDERFREILVGD